MTGLPDAVASSIGAGDGLGDIVGGVRLVDTRIDGQRIVTKFEIAQDEHERRVRSGVTGVTDRRLLHALWALPARLPVDLHALTALDRETLVQHGDGFVEFDGNQVVRVFRPATTVRTVVGVGASFRSALSRIASLPSIYERVAVCTGRESPSCQLADTASRAGIGLLSVVEGETRWWCVAAEAITGVPAVYRWWFAENVYESWRQT